MLVNVEKMTTEKLNIMFSNYRNAKYDTSDFQTLKQIASEMDKRSYILSECGTIGKVATKLHNSLDCIDNEMCYKIVEAYYKAVIANDLTHVCTLATFAYMCGARDEEILDCYDVYMCVDFSDVLMNALV